MTHDYTPGDMLAAATRDPALTELSADIVAAYVAHNSVQPSDLPGLLHSVYDTLAGLGRPVSAVPAAPLVPAVPVKKSVHEDFLVCLEDGKRFKSLKRHLMTAYGMTPAEYRTKWSLEPDYPMVAPAYAKARSALAKEMGLGQKGRGR